MFADSALLLKLVLAVATLLLKAIDLWQRFFSPPGNWVATLNGYLRNAEGALREDGKTPLIQVLDSRHLKGEPPKLNPEIFTWSSDNVITNPEWIADFPDGGPEPFGAEQARQQLAAGKPDDPHVVVSASAVHAGAPAPQVLDVQLIPRFSILQTESDVLKQRNRLIVSANTLLVCPAARQLILQKRAASSAAYGGGLHMFGGGFLPAASYVAQVNRRCDSDLRETARRELAEESGIYTSNQIKGHVVVLLEWSAGFHGYLSSNFFTVISPLELTGIKTNWEGHREFVDLGQLRNKLSGGAKGALVPPCQAAVMSWLALGAPGITWWQRLRFNPYKVFAEIIKTRDGS